jgi:glycosyltransferase involved in cell wall biosynthesis
MPELHDINTALTTNVSTDRNNLEETMAVVREAFDEGFYLSLYNDIAENMGINPLEHYCVFGWKERRDPSSEFSTGFYLDNYPDVCEAGINPLYHYLVFGRTENRQIMRPADVVTERDLKGDMSQEMKIVREAFDKEFYLLLYPDILANKGTDPLEHYCSIGWKERRDPSSDFSTGFYLDNNPDVFSAGINPFYHYLITGKSEGLLAAHPAGHAYEVIRNLRPLEDEVAYCREHAPYKKNPGAPLGKDSLYNLIANNITDTKTLLVAITHDNYTASPGGLQLCIAREQILANERNQNYLAFFPMQPIPRLLHSDEMLEPEIGVILDGKLLGSCTWHDIVASASSLSLAGVDHRLIIHQLLGHDPSQIIAFANASGAHDAILWLHDYITICPSFTLQRNKLQFCGAPAVTSNACEICVYGDERNHHIESIRGLFQHLNIHIVSPSEIALEIWQATKLFEESSSRVIPHITFREENRSSIKERHHPIRIAYVGTIAPHKGWPTFLKLAKSFNHEPDFEFYYFGQGNVNSEFIKKIDINVTGDNVNGMVDALRDEKVDVVLQWPSWPETFSISTCEAFSGGACVITNDGSGNVAKIVDAVGLGKILKNGNDLVGFFSDGELQRVVANLRKARATSTLECRWSNLSHDASDIWAKAPVL